MPHFTDEQQQKLRHHFQEFDRDSNGRIDRDEFKRLLVSLGAVMGEREAERAFSDIDKDGSGHIDFEEFCGWWRFSE